MKYVRVPEAITLKRSRDDDLTETWTFSRYLNELVLYDLAMRTGYAYIAASRHIKAQFENAKPGEWVKLDDDHWQLMHNAIIDPKGSSTSLKMGVSILFMLHQLIPFMEAVVVGYSTEEPK